MQFGVSFIPAQPVDVTVSADLTTQTRLTKKGSSIWVSSAQNCWIKFGDGTVTATVGGAGCIRIPKDSNVAITFTQGTTHVSVIAELAGQTSIVLF